MEMWRMWDVEDSLSGKAIMLLEQAAQGVGAVPIPGGFQENGRCHIQ